MDILKRFWMVLFLVITPVVSASAGAWSDQDFNAYVGNWGGNGFPGKFSHASGMQISFWLNARDGLEGAALISKGKDLCIGHVQLDASQEQLEFSAKEGVLCPNLANSTFSLFRPMKRGVFGLRFHTPPPVDDLYNVTHFHRIQEANPKLQAYVTFFRNNGQNAENVLDTRARHHATAIASIDAALQQPYRRNFQDSKMIGVWEGEFVGGDMVLPAKMVYWSAVPYRYQTIVGVALFDQEPLEEPVCPAGVIKGHRAEDGVTMSYLYLKNQPQPCRTVSSNGRAYWNGDNDTLMLSMDTPIARNLTHRDTNCLKRPRSILDLPAEMCVVGVFHRTRADEGLLREIDRQKWDRVSAPSAADRSILFDRPDQIGHLATAHDQAAVNNLQVDRQIQDERAEIQRRREAERNTRIAEARRREAAKRDRIARNKANYAMQRGGGFVDSSGPVSMPNVSGPFDGLPGKDMLNAIYAQDWDAVAAINTYYSSEKLRQHKNIMGGKHWTDGLMEAGFKSIDISKIVLAVYLFNYQKQYGACLESDAVTFEVVDYAPDTSVKNVLGIEIARFYGYEIHEKFKVNKEFTSAFRMVGCMKPEDGMLTVVEFIMNSGGTDIKRESVSGTKQMMGKFDCQSPEIKQMEKALLQVGR